MGHTTEKMLDLFGTENDGQFLGFLGCGDDVFKTPVFGELASAHAGTTCELNSEATGLPTALL